MIIIKKIQKIFQFIDLYKQPVRILHQGKQTTSLWGGLVTTFVLLISIVLFYQPTMDFISFNVYTWTTNKQYKNNNTIQFQQNRLFFVVLINGVNASSLKENDARVRYTKTTLFQNDNHQVIKQQIKDYQAVPCRLDRVLKYYDTLQQDFQHYNPQTLFCPPQQIQFYLYGSQIHNHTNMGISIYKNNQQHHQHDQQHQRILSQPHQQQHGHEQQNNHGHDHGHQHDKSIKIFKVTHFFDFSKQKPDSVFLENIVDLFETQQQKVQHYQVWIGQQIIDDSNSNIWPSSIQFFSQQNKVFKFPYITKQSLRKQKLKQNQLTRVSIWMSNQNWLVHRQIIKIDVYLSFLGGIFQFINLLGIFLQGSYSQFKMILKIGKIIDFDQKNTQNQLYKHANFLKYLIYRLKKLFCCCQLNQQQQRYYFSQKYAQKITSIDRIQNNLVFLECCVSRLLSKQQIKLLKANFILNKQDAISQSIDSQFHTIQIRPQLQIADSSQFILQKKHRKKSKKIDQVIDTNIQFFKENQQYQIQYQND